MKILSLKRLFQQGWNTFNRFPVAIVLGILGSIIAIYITKFNYLQLRNCDNYYSVILTCAIGIPFLISIIIYCERQKFKPLFKYLFQLAGLILLLCYYFTLSQKLNIEDYIRFFVLFISMHLLVSFIAFTGKNEVNGFWQFNRILFIKLLTAVLYSIVLYVGIALALLAVDNLFNVDLGDKIYFRLWIIIVGIVNTWLFLSGVPEQTETLESINIYPKGIKVFSQYILLPLVTLYFIILYVYASKILILWNLPYGWVSYLILGFSFLGIFSLLLLYPVQSQSDNKWIKNVSKFFYWSLFPLLVLFFIAIYTRISQYGITENRYFILILAIWLTGISAYLLINKINNIKVIPLSLCIIAMLTTFGPFGAFNISVKNQLKRFESIAKRNNMLVNEKIKKTEKEIPFNDNKELSSIVEYISDVHSYKLLQPYFKQNLDSIFNKDNEENKTTKIMQLMGLEYIDRWNHEFNDKNINFFYSSNIHNSKNALIIKDYQYVLSYDEDFRNNDIKNSPNTVKYYIGDTLLNISYTSKTDELNFKYNDSININVGFNYIIKNLYEKYHSYNSNIDSKEMTLKVNTDKLNILLVFKSINGKHEAGAKSDFKLNIVAFDCYIKINK